MGFKVKGLRKWGSRKKKGELRIKRLTVNTQLNVPKKLKFNFRSKKRL